MAERALVFGGRAPLTAQNMNLSNAPIFVEEIDMEEDLLKSVKGAISEAMGKYSTAATIHYQLFETMMSLEPGKRWKIDVKKNARIVTAFHVREEKPTFLYCFCGKFYILILSDGNLDDDGPPKFKFVLTNAPGNYNIPKIRPGSVKMRNLPVAGGLNFTIYQDQPADRPEEANSQNPPQKPGKIQKKKTGKVSGQINNFQAPART